MDTAVRFPTSPKAAAAAPLKLNKRMSVEAAFQAIVRNCIGQVQDNEAGVARYPDLEFLHQMRIALRRLDAAFSLFGDVLPVPPPIADELDWLMDALGPARDWDVFLESTLPRVASGMPEHSQIAAVQAAARDKRDVVRARASEAVCSPRFAKLVRMLESWVDQRAWRDGMPAKAKMRLKVRVGDFAGGVLEREQQRLHRRARKLKDFSVERMHRVRIAAKRARYAAEFFASLFPGKQVRPYVQALKGVQDELGWFNDAVVASRLLDEACGQDGKLREGAALVRGYLAAVRDDGARRSGKAWGKKSLKKFSLALPPK